MYKILPMFALTGGGWFDQLRKEHKEINYATVAEAATQPFSPVNNKEWIQRRNDFLVIECGEKTLASKKHVFLAEIQKLRSIVNPTVAFNVLVFIKFLAINNLEIN